MPDLQKSAVHGIQDNTGGRQLKDTEALERIREIVKRGGECTIKPVKGGWAVFEVKKVKICTVPTGER